LSAFEESVESLRDSARFAHLSSDPAADSLSALVKVMESIAVAFRTRTAERVQTSQSLRDDAEAIAQAAIANVEARGADIVAGLLPRLAAVAEQTVARRLWLVKLRTLLLAGGMSIALAVAVFAVSFGAGYASGRNDGLVSAKIVTGAMAAGPGAASIWAKLMAENDPVSALASCRKQVSKDGQGRRYCAMPVWLDPPAPPNRTAK
jgi:hypothetical protein